MKVVFISNYFNHHQKFLCDALYNMEDVQFHFISTSEMREERKKMGYDKIEIPPYVIRGDISKKELEKGKALIDEADVVICGSAPIQFLKNRVKNNKLIFYYTERQFRSKLSLKKKIQLKLSWKIRAPKRKNVYLLAASAYAAHDYSYIGVFKNKTFKWGYFPEAKEYTSFAKKEPSTILWCARLLPLKRPMDVLNAALTLKNMGYQFTLSFIGNGEEEDKIKSFVNDNELAEYVKFQGFIPTDKVRIEMEKSSIFLFTSDKQEGWGAVLNESMNSGCAVITSHAAGSSKFLVKDGENGLIYEAGNVEMLTSKLKSLLDSPENTKKLGKNAYKTITEKWNPETAAIRFIILAKSILNGNKNPDLFPDGPCSIAPLISDEWKN